MKKLILLSLFALCWSLPASATYTFNSCVGTCTCNTTTAATCSMTPSVTSGDLIVTNVRDGSTVTLSNPTDSQSNTYTCDPILPSQATNFSNEQMCWTIATATGTDTVSCNASGNQNLHCAVDDYTGVPSGCNASNISDGSATGATNGVNAATVTTGNLTTTDTDLIVLGGAAGTNETWNGPSSLIFGSAPTLRANAPRSAMMDRLSVGAATNTSKIAANTSTDMAAIAQAFHGTSCASASVKRLRGAVIGY